LAHRSTGDSDDDHRFTITGPETRASDYPPWVVSHVLAFGITMPNQPAYCDFCSNSNGPLYEAVFEPTIHICANITT
jgi:hypothetical protein